MNIRDTIFTAVLFGALYLSSQADRAVESLALANVSALLLIFYAVRGRWQAVPLATIAIAIVVLRMVIEGAFPWWLSGALAVLAIAFSGLLFFSPVPLMPRPSGNHNIGLLRTQVRREDRIIQAYIWYPATERNRPVRPYFTKGESIAISAGYKSVGAPGFMNSHMRLVRTHSIENAPVQVGQYPLVVFNHGGGLYPLQNFSLMEELCSHGMICISIGHGEESLALGLPDEEPVLINPELLAEMAGSQAFQDDNVAYLLARGAVNRVRSFHNLALHTDNKLTNLADEWAQDSLFLLDALMDGNAQDVPEDLRSSIDRERTAHTGMSLGGTTAALCCRKDRHAQAGVNLDGFIWDFELAETPVNKPFLQFYADPNSLLKMVTQKTGTVTKPVELSPDLPMPNDIYFAETEQTTRRLILPGISHMGFTDSALSARPGTSAAFGLGARANRSSVVAVNRLTMAFLCDALKISNSESSLDEMVSEFERTGVVIPQSNAPLTALRNV